MKLKYDKNGNKVLMVQFSDGKRGFSIQTLGNLPETHRNGITSATDAEVRDYLTKHGTLRQKELYGID